MKSFVVPAILVITTLAIGLILSAPIARDAVIVDTVWEGPARVSDGDSLRIGQTRIRLYGIDAPERDQTCVSAEGDVFSCGDVATRALTDYVSGADVRCEHIEYDRYSRSVSRCFAGALDLGRQMVLAGFARAYLRYSTDYAREEEVARSTGAGFWSGEMQAPADFRANSQN